ncbi:MAG: phage tail tape measure protein [Clostridium sp.]|nr:phage tail tape measure protein [Bacteroidales bacterium]MCM1511236.1 phage tail tape measure protein [Clostridium sp.]
MQAVADIFNVDFRETLEAANALSKQFGISADEALKLVQKGFVAGGDANGEFIDTLKEYPAYFKEAGISAEQFVAISAQMGKAGLFSDKGVDAIKEANLRLREMTTATASALDGIGISSKQVQKDLESGTKTTFEVMQQVSQKLSELPESSSKVGTAIADIFGGPGEDAGLQYLQTLKDIELNMDNVKAEAGELGRLQEEQLNAQLELENALAGLFDMTGGSFETMTTHAKTFVSNGITAIIKGVICLANYVISLYNDSVTFRALWNGIVNVFKYTFATVGNLFNAFLDLLKATGTALKAAFTFDVNALVSAYAQAGTALKNLVKAQVVGVAKVMEDTVAGINKKATPITIPVSVEGMDSVSQPNIKTGDNVTGNTSSDKKSKKGKDTSKDVEQAYKKNLEATRKYQDAVLALEQNEWYKRRQQTVYQYSRQIEDLQHQLLTEKTLTAEGKKAITATIETLQLQQADALMKLEQDEYTEQLERQKSAIALRLQAVREGSEEEYNLKLQQIENERQLALLKNEQQPEGKRQNTGDINAVYDKQAAGIADEYMRAQLAIFDQQQNLAASEFDLLRNSEERKTRFRLEQEKTRLQKILELNKAAGQKLSDVEVETINNTIKKIEQEIGQSKKDEKSKDIYGMFGLNLDDDQKEAINTSMDFAKEALQGYLDAYKAAADAKVEAANKEVDSAQKTLDAEKEARANGYASDVATAQKELDLAKKNQKKALDEQKKAAKAQQAIQQVEQIGNLVSATALIWKQLGFPWAIPAIAVMWGSFAAAKIKAAQVTASSESYGEGTVELLSGGSHQSGKDVDLGRKSDGTRRRAEGGEFFAVINKRNSRRYRHVIPNVIHALNDGTFADKYLNVYPTDNGLVMNIGGGDAPDLRNLSADVREIKEQNRRRVYVDGAGNTIIEYRNLRRRVRSV